MEFFENDEFIRIMEKVHMNILDMAYVCLGTEWRCDTCRVPYTRVYYVNEGQGEISCNGRSLSLLPGNIYIIPAESEFSYSCDSYLSKLFFHIRISWLEKHDLFANCKECIVLKNRKTDIDYAQQLWKMGDLTSAVLLKAQLYEILKAGIRQARISFGNIADYSEMVNNVIIYIDEHLNSALTAEKIAQAMFVATASLQKRFRQEAGISLGHYIDEQVMLAAEKLLRVPGLTVREISDRLGFCDQFYFSRCFNRRYGVSPTKYRKNLNL